MYHFGISRYFSLCHHVLSYSYSINLLTYAFLAEKQEWFLFLGFWLSAVLDSFNLSGPVLACGSVSRNSDLMNHTLFLTAQSYDLFNKTALLFIPPRTGSHSTLFVRAPHSKASGRLQRPVPLLQVRDVQSGASVSCPSYRNQCGILRVTSDHLPTVSHNVMHRTTSFLILKFLLSIRGEPSKSIAPNLKSRKTRFAFSQRVPYRTGQTI